jgi:hypothetical protein
MQRFFTLVKNGIPFLGYIFNFIKQGSYSSSIIFEGFLNGAHLYVQD